MRLIDADALMGRFVEKAYQIQDRHGVKLGEKWLLDYDEIKAVIDNAPAIELTELCKSCQYLKDCETCEEKLRPQGEWEYVQYDANPNIGNWHCSECRLIVSGKYNQKPGYNFCPRCGAQMRGDL